MKKAQSKIRFLNTTIYYGKTTVKELLSFELEIVPNTIACHPESNTMTCKFSRYGEYIGELVFLDYYGKDTINEQYICDLTIDLVLLDNDDIEQGFGLWEFLGLTGKVGRRNVLFLVCSYIFLMAISFIFRSEIPDEFFYACFALPVVLFCFAILFWCLKRLFSSIYHRFSSHSLVLFLSLFLVWNTVLSYTVQKLAFAFQTMDDEIPFYVCIFTLLIIETFIAIEFCWFQTQYLVRYKRSYKIIAAFLNFLPFGIFFLFKLYYSDEIATPILASYTDAFIICLGMQLFWYTLVTGVFWAKYLCVLVMDYFFPEKTTK